MQILCSYKSDVSHLNVRTLSEVTVQLNLEIHLAYCTLTHFGVQNKGQLITLNLFSEKHFHLSTCHVYASYVYVFSTSWNFHHYQVYNTHWSQDPARKVGLKIRKHWKVRRKHHFLHLPHQLLYGIACFQRGFSISGQHFLKYLAGWVILCS